MASLLVKAEDLGVGDVMLLPFGRTAVIDSIKPFGEKATYVYLKASYVQGGEICTTNVKLERTHEVNIQARVI